MHVGWDAVDLPSRGENYGYRTPSGLGWSHVRGARGGPLGRPLLTSGHKRQDVPSYPGARFMYTHTHTHTHTHTYTHTHTHTHTHTRLAQQGPCCAALGAPWGVRAGAGAGAETGAGAGAGGRAGVVPLRLQSEIRYRSFSIVS